VAPTPTSGFAFARSLAVSAAILIAVLAPASLTGCGGADDAAGPTESLCSTASFDGAGIGFNLGCSSYSSNVTGITYDQFSRVTSYNYDISCTGGSEKRAGRVYNITYNEFGQPLTWDYTVNGQTCRKS
jgi:hypothetical protein